MPYVPFFFHPFCLHPFSRLYLYHEGSSDHTMLKAQSQKWQVVWFVTLNKVNYTKYLPPTLQPTVGETSNCTPRTSPIIKLGLSIVLALTRVNLSNVGRKMFVQTAARYVRRTANTAPHAAVHGGSWRPSAISQSRHGALKPKTGANSYLQSMI